MDLGRRLAKLIPAKNPPAILMQGDLGAGKTTFVRALVQNLPGGDEAEVSSPSFNLVNIYPTTPEIAHIDLYRLPFGEVEDDILDYFHDPDYLAIVEWIDHIRESMWPREYLYMVFQFTPPQNGKEETDRSVILKEQCTGSRQILEGLTS